MLTSSPTRLATAFRVAAAELGYWTTSWIFVSEVSRDGAASVERLRDELGRTFPVLDAVARRWLEGERSRVPRTEPVLRCVEGAARLLVCGVETGPIDALCSLLGSRHRIGIVRHSTSEVDWDRFLANYAGRIEGVDLTTFQLWAGHDSVLLTFAYGTRDHATHVDPAAARILGPDVRMQFRSVVAWELLRTPMYVYPRWLTEVPLGVFSDVLT